MASITDLLNHLSYLPATDKKILATALTKPPVAAIKINTNKTNAKYIKNHFPDIKNHPLFDDCFIFEKSQYQLGKHPFFTAGLYYIQEPSAMCVVPFADIKEDDKVLDLCAAPGGKSVAIAQILKSGLLVSNDVNYQRAKILQENLEKWGCDNCLVLSNEVKDLVAVFANYFDKIILDVPCSLEGTIRKDKEALSLWSKNKVESLAKTQKYLIEQALLMLKKGGQLIYSTCTFAQEENEDVINYALTNFDVSLVYLPDSPYFRRGIKQPQSIRLYPGIAPGEGHFIAKLVKHSDTGDYFVAKIKSQITKNAATLLTAFCKNNLTINFEPKYLFQLGKNLYYFKHPLKLPFKPLMYGLYLGQVEKSYFTPSHHLALYLKKDDVKKYLNLSADDQQLIKYFHGETLTSPLDNGFILILADNHSVGFGKISNNIIKNFFPKKLRLQ